MDGLKRFSKLLIHLKASICLYVPLLRSQWEIIVNSLPNDFFHLFYDNASSSHLLIPFESNGQLVTAVVLRSCQVESYRTDCSDICSQLNPQPLRVNATAISTASIVSRFFADDARFGPYQMLQTKRNAIKDRRRLCLTCSVDISKRQDEKAWWKKTIGADLPLQ